DAACSRGVIVLDQDAIEQRAAVVESAARPDRRLLQFAHPGSGLSRVEQPHLRARERLRVAPGERRDAAEAHHEIQRGPFAGEDGAQRSADAQDPLAGTGSVRLSRERLQLAGGVESAEHPRRGRDAGPDQRLLGEDQRAAAGRERDAGLGGAVAGTDVLLERERDQPPDGIVRAAGIEHGSVRRLRMRPGTGHSYFVPLRGDGRRLPPLLPRAPRCAPRPCPGPRTSARDFVRMGRLRCFFSLPPAPRVPFFAPRAAATRPAFLPRPTLPALSALLRPPRTLFAPALALCVFGRRGMARSEARAWAISARSSFSSSSDTGPRCSSVPGTFSMIPRAIDFTREMARAARPSASSSSLASVGASAASRALPITSSPAPASSPAPDCIGGLDGGAGGLDCCGGLDGGGGLDGRGGSDGGRGGVAGGCGRLVGGWRGAPSPCGCSGCVCCGVPSPPGALAWWRAAFRP